ncbi:hypothetical protein OROGR_006607 [Orobanche gracilis]
METNKINQFFGSVTNFFGGGDHVPWSTPDVVLTRAMKIGKLYSAPHEHVARCSPCHVENDGCEREVVDARKEESADRTNESIMRLSWALVHSRKPEDVQRGIAMLEGVYNLSDLDPLDVVINKTSLTNTNSPLQTREKLYLLAVGYYRSGDYARSRQLLDQCLEIEPDMRQALSLKKTVEDRITKDGVIGIGITATAVGLIAGGIAAALARKK